MAEAVKSGTKIYLTQGDNSIQYYDPLKSKTLQGGELVNVTGYYTKYGNTNELAVYSAEDVEIVEKPVVTLTGVPTSSLSAAEQDITVNYTVANLISGASVSASTEADWLEAEAEDGEILIMVGSNDGETVYSAERTGVVTVSYPYTADQTITITQSGNSFAITYATVQGGTLSGPARAKVNQEVTLVATPASDIYTFNDDWTVTPALTGVTAPTVTNNKFTMPASDVTVSGSFTGNASTATLTVSSINSAHAMGTGSYGDYKDKDVAITIDGLNLTAKNICANSKDGNKGLAASQFIQMKSGSSYIYNTSGSVSSVKIWVLPSTASGLVIKSGVSQNPSAPLTNPTPTTENVTLKDNNNSNVSTSLSVYEFTSTGSYISIAPTATLWVYKVEIVYN